MDYQKSLSEYPELLARWSALQKSKKRDPVRGAFRIVDLHEKWAASIAADFGADYERFCRLHTKHFLHGYGDLLVKDFGPVQLEELKAVLVAKEYSAKTIKHCLDSVKSMFKWGAGMGLCAEVNFKAVRTPTQKPPTPEPLDKKQLQALLQEGERHDPRLGPWMRLNYLAFMRVSEVKRLVHQEGEWVEEGIFKLSVSKMQAATGVPRHIILTPQALVELKAAAVCWRGKTAYHKAVTRACGTGGPHVLRDSAASHLLEVLGPEGLESVKWLLGHISRGAWQHYGRIPWQRLRETAARLAL